MTKPYRQIRDMSGQISTAVVQRTSDNAFIPNDPPREADGYAGNADWVEYQAWLDADPNNIPEPPVK